MKYNNIKKVVLAYSGGLDTSIIVKWLQENYSCEVVTYTADLGQKGELDSAKKRAKKLGVKNIYLDDLKEEFAKDFIFPMFRANTLYEEQYLLGTAIARPLISKKLIEVAKECGADAISHGATGKGNDQVRFELSAYSLNPDIKIIAPWREWNLNSRDKLLSYASVNNIPVDMDKNNTAPYSMDANLLHISYEGKVLENPWVSPSEDMWRWTTSPQNAPDKAEEIEIEFSKGDPVAVNGKNMSPANILEFLNNVGAKNAIGRLDIIENRFVGMKSRGCYETPGGTIILHARRAIESVTLDREVAHLKTELMPKYANIIYNGFWWSPERLNLQKFIDSTQESVNGYVRLSLYKGNVIIEGRKSETNSLYNPDLATFDEDHGVYDQKDADGFIALNALRLKNRVKN
ncbi:MAG: argininosuccinate synthase [Gammaproteobacteria bacterium]|jgi:argininosuccinate synthase|nr:argininosuccinate synthase [Gammaproteobacteria bacterium]MBT7603154.1 argininosuccinate synthase [Gammaproteobacteria bacterium]